MQAVIVNRSLHSPTSNRALPKSNTQERPLKNFSGKTAFGPRVLAQVPGHGHRFEEFCPSRDKTHYKGSVTPTRLTSDSGSKRTGGKRKCSRSISNSPRFLEVLRRPRSGHSLPLQRRRGGGCGCVLAFLIATLLWSLKGSLAYDCVNHILS